MKIVYIAHKISGNIPENLQKIKRIIRHINLSCPDIIPFAHYVVDCESLDDDNPQERERGIKNDMEFFQRGFIDELWICSEISSGILNEINTANKFGIKVIDSQDYFKNI